LKKAILTYYWTDPESCGQAFLAQMRQLCKSFLVYFAVLEQLYWDTFSIKEGTALNEPSQKAVTLQFLREIPQAISGLEKYLNSTLPIGQVTQILLAPGTSPLAQVFKSLIIHEPKKGSQTTGMF